MVILCLALWVIAKFFPQWLHHLTFPPVMRNSFNFSASLSALVIFCLFFSFYGHSSGCKAVTNDFDYILITIMLSIFSCVYLKFVYLLWRSVSFCCSCLNCVFILLFSWRNSLYILDRKLIRYVICKYSLPFCGLSFHALDSIFWYTNLKKLSKVQIIYVVMVNHLF